jgi:LEA14-like dessication related protein
MKRHLVFLALAAGLLVSTRPGLDAARPQEKDSGAIEKVEVSTISRDVAAVWVRTQLPQVAKGWKQTFSGEIQAGGVPIAVQKPVTVAIQPKGAGNEAVFMIDVDLAKLPPAILQKAGAKKFEATIRGTLTGDNDSKTPISASGVLALGSSQVEAPSNNLPAFFKFGGASLAGLSFSELKGEAKVVLFNPLSFPVDVKELRYRMTYGETKLAEGTRTGVRLHARRENTVVIPIVVKNSDLVSAVGVTVRNKGTVEGRLSGAVTLRSGGQDIVLPFNAPGTIQLLP